MQPAHDGHLWVALHWQRRRSRDPASDWKASVHAIKVCGSTLYPTKIVCVGRNYVAHIRELGNEVPDGMVVFNKPNSAITNTLRAEIAGQTLHYESELAFTVQGGALAAVGFGLDLTKRALQAALKEKGLPWERAKAFDGAALFSDFVALPANLNSLSLRLEVDGEVRQAGGVGLMLFPPHAILRELATFTTLEDGDIIMTGTPAGVGEIRAGQLFEGSVLQGESALVAAAWVAQ
jgi:2-keto-4-pentenoate hydratase/2-oxohepta-3-ene-1,7-dioic acid hydratase in catechol pathway